VTSWCDDVTRENARRYAAKLVKKYLKSLKKHEIKRKFISFTYKIEIYFIREHQLLYFHSWLRHSWKYCICYPLSEMIFQSYMQNKKISSISSSHNLVCPQLYRWRKTSGTHLYIKCKRPDDNDNIVMMVTMMSMVFFI
jgi:hypothetical protein